MVRCHKRSTPETSHCKSPPTKIPSFIKAAFYVQKYCRKEYTVTMPHIRQALKSTFNFHVASRQTGIEKCNLHLLAIYKNASTNRLAVCCVHAMPLHSQNQHNQKNVNVKLDY